MEKAHNNSMGWKVLGVFGLVFAVVWAGGAAWGVAATLIGRQLHFSETTISTVSLLGIAFIRMVLWIPLTRLVLKRSLGEIAFRFHPGWWLDLLMGAGITVLAISVIFLIAVNAGWLVIEGRVWQSLSTGVYLGKLWVSLLINILVALMEEIIFRAYLLTGLMQAWGKAIGLVVMAVAFSLVHVPALEGSSPFTVVCALLFLAAFGLLFGWVYLRTGSLWMPIGIHFAWDFVENDLLNLSGDMTNPHVIGMATRLAGLPNLGGLGNALLLDGLVLAILAGLAWVWLTWLRQPAPTPAWERKKSMDEIEPGLKEFLDYWYAGFTRGVESLDEASRRKVLGECGKACARSYTVQIFRQVKEKSADLDAFLQNLSARGPGASYERTGPNTIKATYKNCGCDLVRLGLVKSPALCDCSAANLRENLEQSWGRSASVEVESSILRGGTACVLRVTLGDEVVEPE